MKHLSVPHPRHLGFAFHHIKGYQLAKNRSMWYITNMATKPEFKTTDITEIPLPQWLTDPRSTQEITYENFFATALEEMVGGRPLSHIVRDDPRGLSYTKVLNWIHKDEKRQEMYYQAQALGAEAVADELLYIADGAEGSPEDVQRSKLRIDTRRWLLEVWNKKRFGKDSDRNANTGVTVVVQRGASVQLVTGEKQVEEAGRLIEGDVCQE